jgi:YVTN family beta-propeller protein
MRISKTTLAFLTVGALAAPGVDAATLVVLNKAEATASLIDLDTGKVKKTLPTGDGPHEVAVSPDGTVALVTNYGNSKVDGNSLTVIDIGAGKVIRTIDLGKFKWPHGVRFLGGGRAVVTAEENKALLVVNVETGEIEREIHTKQDDSHMVAVTPDGSRAFVANIGSGSVTAIDLDEGRVLAQIETGEGSEGIDVTPDGKEVWVTNRAADTVSVLDAASLEVLVTVPCATFPIRVRITPDGRHALVSNARSADLAVFDVATRKEVKRIAFEREAASTEGRLFGDQFGNSSVPIGVVVAPDGSTAWVAHSNADTISVVDLKSWKTTGHLFAGKEPDGMAYSPR